MGAKIVAFRSAADKSRAIRKIFNKWDQDTDEFLQSIVTGEETCSYEYSPNDKAKEKQ